MNATCVACVPQLYESFRTTHISLLIFLHSIRKIVLKFFFTERFIKLLMAFIHNFLLLLLPSICLLEFRGSAAGTDLLSRRYWSIFSLPLRWGSHFLTLPRSHLCCPKRYSWGHETTSNISTLFFQNHFPPPFFKTQKED